MSLIRLPVNASDVELLEETLRSVGFSPLDTRTGNGAVLPRSPEDISHYVQVMQMNLNGDRPLCIRIEHDHRNDGVCFLAISRGGLRRLIKHQTNAILCINCFHCRPWFDRWKGEQRYSCRVAAKPPRPGQTKRTCNHYKPR